MLVILVVILTYHWNRSLGLGFQLGRNWKCYSNATGAFVGISFCNTVSDCSMQPGNPTPRVFHLPVDDGLINRYGFPSKGHSYVLSNLRTRIPLHYPSASAGGIIDPASSKLASGRDGQILAVNLGKNKTSAHESPDDFIRGVHAFGEVADVLVVNVSSPNTPGLRSAYFSRVLNCWSLTL